MSKITPFLWFETQAEEAAKFYVSIFKNSKIIATTYMDEESSKASGMPVGSVWVVEFELAGQKFYSLNSNTYSKFNPSVSFAVDVEDQAELDYYWDRLSAVPEAEACGWLCDKFGLSWQIVPSMFIEMLKDPDKTKVGRLTAVLTEMKKIDIAAVRAAFEHSS